MSGNFSINFTNFNVKLYVDPNSLAKFMKISEGFSECGLNVKFILKPGGFRVLIISQGKMVNGIAQQSLCPDPGTHCE